MREPKSLVLPLHHRVAVAECDQGSKAKFTKIGPEPVGDVLDWWRRFGPAPGRAPPGGGTPTASRLHPAAVHDGEAELLEFDRQIDADVADAVRQVDRYGGEVHDAFDSRRDEPVGHVLGGRRRARRSCRA